MSVAHRKRLGTLKEIQFAINEPGLNIQCDSCLCDLTHSVRIKCADPDCEVGDGIDICPACFCAGKEFRTHKRGHAYRVVEPPSFPIFAGDWGADEEFSLMQGIALQGLGNWQAVSDHVGTRTKEEVEEHYNNVYINSPSWPLPISDFSIEVEFDHTRFHEHNRQKTQSISVAAAAPPPKRAPTSAPSMHEISTFVPDRLEFEHELDNEAEDLVIRCETMFRSDYQLPAQHQNTPVDIHNDIYNNLNTNQNHFIHNVNNHAHHQHQHQHQQQHQQGQGHLHPHPRPHGLPRRQTPPPHSAVTANDDGEPQSAHPHREGEYLIARSHHHQQQQQHHQQYPRGHPQAHKRLPNNLQTPPVAGLSSAGAFDPNTASQRVSRRQRLLESPDEGRLKPSLDATQKYSSSLSNNKNIAYDYQLKQLLDDLRSIDLSEDIFEQTEYFNFHGSSSDVFKAKSRRHGNMFVAVKRLRFHIYRNKDVSKLIFRELKVWCGLDHQHILPLLGYVMHGRYPALVSKWMVNGSLRDYIEHQPEIANVQMARGIASGLAYLHERNIIHSDLKTDNIFVSELGGPMLADFGISRIITATHCTTSTSLKGSTRWMAIELWPSDSSKEDDGGMHTKQTDVWAFGMVVYELLTRRVPYYETKNDVRVSFAIAHYQLPSQPPKLDGENGQMLWSICQECWKRDPLERPNIASIYMHLSESSTGDSHSNMLVV